MADEQHEFLSDEWFTAVGALADEYRGQTPAPAVAVKMNQVITDTPFGSDVRTYIDTSSGEIVLERGVAEGAEATVTLDYGTAKALFVRFDMQAAMQAFMSGRIRVDGDPTKLLALAQTPLGKAAEIGRRIQAITI